MNTNNKETKCWASISDYKQWQWILNISVTTCDIITFLPQVNSTNNTSENVYNGGKWLTIISERKMCIRDRGNTWHKAKNTV